MLENGLLTKWIEINGIARQLNFGPQTRSESGVIVPMCLHAFLSSCHGCSRTVRILQLLPMAGRHSVSAASSLGVPGTWKIETWN
jgi:predicted choloylglycine hydrolase